MIRTCDCLDKQFHALANDTRLKIIGLLMRERLQTILLFLMLLYRIICKC